MSNLKDKLIKLGSENPELQKHLRPVLGALEKEGKDMVTVECPRGHRWEVEDDPGTYSDVFDEECPECGLPAEHVV